MTFPRSRPANRYEQARERFMSAENEDERFAHVAAMLDSLTDCIIDLNLRCQALEKEIKKIETHSYDPTS